MLPVMLILEINGHAAAGDPPGCEIPFNSDQGREQSIPSLCDFCSAAKKI